MKYFRLISLVLLSVSMAFGQVDLKHLQGSWFIKEVKQAPNSPKKIEDFELEFALESMQEGYVHIGPNSFGFYYFEGDFVQDVEDELNYTYNSATKFIELKFKDSDEDIGYKLKLIQVSASQLIYQYVDDEYIADYHFVRATSEQFILGNWSVSSLNMDEYIASLSPEEKYLAPLIVDQLQVEFSLFFVALLLDKTGYIEVPIGDGETASSDLTWHYSANLIQFNYDNGSSEQIKVISLKHNELVVEMPSTEYKIILTLKRG